MTLSLYQIYIWSSLDLDLGVRVENEGGWWVDMQAKREVLELQNDHRILAYVVKRYSSITQRFQFFT